MMGGNGWRDARVDRWMVGCMHGLIDGWKDGWVDGWMGGWVDGWMDGCSDEQDCDNGRMKISRQLETTAA